MTVTAPVCTEHPAHTEAGVPAIECTGVELAGHGPLRGVTAAAADRCRCSHPRRTHEHYRAGNDCGLCACRDYQHPGAPRARIEWDRLAVWGVLIPGCAASVTAAIAYAVVRVFG